MGLTINSNFSGVAYGASSAMKSAQGIMGRSLKKISTNKAYAGGGGGGVAAVKASAQYKISAAKNEAAYYDVQKKAASLSQKIAMQESKLEATIAKAADSSGFSALTLSTAFTKDPSVGTVGSSITDAETIATSLAANYNQLQIYDYQASYYQNMAGAGESSYAAVTDTDIAMEMSKYVKANVNSQAAQAMVAQANQSMATILNLLQ